MPEKMSKEIMKRPFEILGIQQIAIGGLDKEKLSFLWSQLLGLSKIGTYKNEKENVDEEILLLGKGKDDPHAVEIDLMQPIDPNGSPKVQSPALNHIGLWVDDIEKAVEYLTQKGVRFTPGGIRKGASGFNVCFIHPKGNDDFPLSGLGVLIELVEAPPHIRKAKQVE